MKLTVDEAGRVLIPAELRQRLGLKAGTSLDVVVDERVIRLKPSVSRPELVRRGERLVVQPADSDGETPDVDAVRWVEEERDRWPPGSWGSS